MRMPQRRDEVELQEKRHVLGLYLERYKGLSPLGKLSQGYAFVADSGAGQSKQR